MFDRQQVNCDIDGGEEAFSLPTGRKLFIVVKFFFKLLLLFLVFHTLIYFSFIVREDFCFK